MRVLVVVDMQNDFIYGALGSKEAQAIVPKVCEKIKAFDGTLMVTYDTHRDDYLKTQEGINLPIKHCIRGTDGWQIHDRVRSAINECLQSESCELYEFEKPTFGSTDLAEKLTWLEGTEHIDEVTLIGLCTDICVISNAMLIKAYLPEVKITVDAACCAGVKPGSHINALEAMKMCQINIENT